MLEGETEFPIQMLENTFRLEKADAENSKETRAEKERRGKRVTNVVTCFFIQIGVSREEKVS